MCAHEKSVLCTDKKCRERVLHLFYFLYDHSSLRWHKQIWLFTTTQSAETEVCSRWSALAVPDNVADVASTGFQERRLKKVPSL